MQVDITKEILNYIIIKFNKKEFLYLSTQ
jgi:hypothetical protein